MTALSTFSSSLSDLDDRREKSRERRTILPHLQ